MVSCPPDGRPTAVEPGVAPRLPGAGHVVGLGARALRRRGPPLQVPFVLPGAGRRGAGRYVVVAAGADPGVAEACEPDSD